MSSDDRVPPFRAHDWIVKDGFITRSKREFHPVPLRLVEHQPQPEPMLPPTPPPTREVCKPILSQREHIAACVAKLTRRGYSYKAAMEAILDEEPVTADDYELREGETPEQRSERLALAWNTYADNIMQRSQPTFKDKAFAACEAIDSAMQDAVSALKKPIASVSLNEVKTAHE